MKVVSTADPATFRKEALCDGCETVVELEIGDLRVYSDQREGTSYEWRCPTCKRPNYHGEDFVPRNMKYAVKVR